MVQAQSIVDSKRNPFSAGLQVITSVVKAFLMWSVSLVHGAARRLYLKERQLAMGVLAREEITADLVVLLLGLRLNHQNHRGLLSEEELENFLLKRGKDLNSMMQAVLERAAKERSK